ncbi:MAG: BrnA antitoxin family protein [Methylobacterium frigidaeris]
MLLSLRLDPDVVEAFKATGPGWQTRINEVLADAARKMRAA